MVQEGFVDLDRGVSSGEFGKTRGFSRGDEFLRRPDVVGGRLCKEIGQVRILGLLYRLEVILPGKSDKVYEDFGAMFLCQPAGLGLLLAKSSEGGGPPGF